MTDESQITGTAARYTDPLTIRCGDTSNKAPAETPRIAVQDGTPARLPVDIRNEYERRICQLEARLEALENKLDSAIMREKEAAEAFKRGFLDVVGTFNKQYNWKIVGK